MGAALVLLAIAALLAAIFRREPRPEENARPIPAPEADRVPALRYRSPTEQTRVGETPTEAVFMPTASGRLESALYGSTRTRNVNGRIRASFHEGIDIAPLHRDRRGRPLDTPVAVAAGTVAYIHRRAGNSNYGNYVVLRHSDPVGEIYTLYAHLASIAQGLAVGQTVPPGTVLGVMGNTGDGIPVARSHLHFEIGLIGNERFDSWYRARQFKPDHGLYHGWNLNGIDPLTMFTRNEPDGTFSMKSFLLREPATFELLIAPRGPVDYFRRYPALWQSDKPARGAMVLSISDGGVPLRGRPATTEETAALRNTTAVALRVDEERLGRNGRGLLTRTPDRSGWRLSASGEQWLEILLYPYTTHTVNRGPQTEESDQ